MYRFPRIGVISVNFEIGGDTRCVRQASQSDRMIDAVLELEDEYRIRGRMRAAWQRPAALRKPTGAPNSPRKPRGP